MNRQSNVNEIRIFLIGSFVFSWSCWIFLIASGVDPLSQSDPRILLWPIGQVGPAAGVLLLILNRKRKTSIRSDKVIAGTFRSNNRQLKWYGTLFLPLISMLPSALLLRFETGSWMLPPLSAFLLMAIPFIILSFAEEIGWRGYLVTRLLKTRTPFSSSLVTGGIWTLWHIPILYFFSFEDAAQFIVYFIGYALTLMMWSLIFTWVYEGSKRNLLIVTLLHASFTITYNTAASFIPSVGIYTILGNMTLLVITGVIWIIRKEYWMKMPEN